ncbi:MAG: peptidase prepilin type [Lacrimispora sp.]|jgi:prepilin peptidase CpaA|nr:peptidase prepilin type [Lacrimispora sp.]
MVLFFILAAGSYFDVREHRIPNWLIFVGMATGLLLSGMATGREGQNQAALWVMMFFLGRFLIVTAAFFLLFLCRMIGAGDIKIIALICAYLGYGNGSTAVAAGFLIGAIWSLVLMTVKGSTFHRFSYFLTYFRSFIQTKKITAYYSSSRDGYDAVIPLGFCMFLGTLLAVVFCQPGGLL